MAIGERIRHFRMLNGMTQKWLGSAVGFSEKTADIRMTQYESGSRTPKDNVVDNLAGIFDVDPRALKVPDTDSYVGLMHTLFALEDMYGLTVNDKDGKPCITLNVNHNAYMTMLNMLNSWKLEADKVRSGEITKEEYDNWRYNYPKFDTTQIWAKMPSQELSDALVEAFRDKIDDM